MYLTPTVYFKKVNQTQFTDNQTQFTASEFGVFGKPLAIEHIITPPDHPRSNGQAEHFLNTFKRAQKKSQREK